MTKTIAKEVVEQRESRLRETAHLFLQAWLRGTAPWFTAGIGPEKTICDIVEMARAFENKLEEES